MPSVPGPRRPASASWRGRRRRGTPCWRASRRPNKSRSARTHTACDDDESDDDRYYHFQSLPKGFGNGNPGPVSCVYPVVLSRARQKTEKSRNVKQRMGGRPSIRSHRVCLHGLLLYLPPRAPGQGNPGAAKGLWYQGSIVLERDCLCRHELPTVTVNGDVPGRAVLVAFAGLLLGAISSGAWPRRDAAVCDAGASKFSTLRRAVAFHASPCFMDSKNVAYTPETPAGYNAYALERIHLGPAAKEMFSDTLFNRHEVPPSFSVQTATRMLNGQSPCFKDTTNSQAVR